MTAPVQHRAIRVHLREGWIRWAAACPCGYFERERPGVNAHDLADDHNDQHGVQPVPVAACTCYNPDTLEYDDTHPCVYCRERGAA